MNLNVSSFFDKGGLISAVKPDFKPREGQADLASAVLKAMRDKKHVTAEAPTGFGKSFSVLVPAIIESVKNQRRTVISTETLTLQDQYLEKDLPLLAKALKPLGISISFAAAKGRNNYICRTKLSEEGAVESTALTRWASLQQIPVSGDIASADIEFDVSEWRKIGADEDCEKRGCPFYGDGAEFGGETECFVYQARRNMLEADILVTNHTLFLLDAQNDAGSILGQYHHAIIDEAHSFAEKAQDCWGNSFRNQTLSRALSSADRTLRRVGLANFFSREDFVQAKLCESAVFEPMRDIKDTLEFGKLPLPVQDRVRVALKDAVSFVKELNVRLKAQMSGNEGARDTVVEVCMDRFRKLVGVLNTVTGSNLDEEHKDNWLSFVNSEWNPKRREFNRSINLKPISVAPLINSRILSVIPSVTFLSATMKVNNGFGFIRSELGLAKDTTVEFTGESPFDFMEQVQLYLPKHLPDAKDPNYISALCDETVRIINHTKGRTLVLFTNSGHMKAAHEIVADRVRYTCYLQGQAPRSTLIDLFSEDVSSCLFATRSFFTGVDIPGEALSCVVLVKAPFRVPSDPLFKARCDKIEEAGRSSFADLSMPRMIFDVRQAFGRLIRTTTDTGVFALLDSRALNSSYAPKIKNALPQAPRLKI